MTMQRTVAAILAAFFCVACDMGSPTTSPTVTPQDAYTSDSQPLKPDDYYADTLQMTDTTTTADGCMEYPWLSSHNGAAVACASAELLARGEANHCNLELYEDATGTCIAKCQPAFHEYVSKIQQTNTGFTLQKSYGPIYCSFGSSVIVE
ncbi:MAG: hypothetical protein COU32_01965 [Candidatus Magasanikbacteria bacterium CG10_big_fil_rev_8_21_14_0_10_42_10]|uniref:Uncharacterized protein n=2 Tax=Candidatus Magasanikiibacteriota TaxID=1752731 RepID=A0A2H0TWC0_9BACT|nr:MAG: hypothetical protein COU32_01965 [Candidatus Magasanikbacteria bacterium CG10_big_fil_rev_8_21_14_0_10_42_10]PIZ92547.1 MAG: hypothetical protein COX82_04560 [Candidatus Magasanikbacteria bacterium CG_4_10_14_0_2_um_filter_41_10]